jgi:hypothetical protein
MEAPTQSRVGTLRRLATPALLVALTAGLCANPPLSPLPPPFYSFDLSSPTVLAGFVGADDILAYGFPHPLVAVPASALGLGLPGDDLDALGGNDAATPSGTLISLLFSVNRQTIGTADPDPGLLAAGIPFNAKDQAWREQAAGDLYMSLELFAAPSFVPAARYRVTNNALVRNNYDEGGESFSAEPPTSAQDSGGGAPQDNTDASAGAAAPAAEGGAVFRNIYFSLTRQSPSLQVLPGHQFPSGAHLYFNANDRGRSPTQLYAAFFELGLVQGDDIDALIVLDAGTPGIFDTGDRILFSLDRLSPSRNTIPGHSAEGAAADVFMVEFGFPPTTLAQAAQLGLGATLDNIDALDLFPCDDAYSCALLHGIQSNRGDLNCDHAVDFDDINAFVLAISDPSLYATLFPYCNWYNGDCDCDGDVDFDDINGFVACLAGDCPCPVPPPANDRCADAQAIAEPYPVTVFGTNKLATIDYPGVLDWNAVWYRVHLPYASNHVAVRYCGAEEGFGTVGIVYYDACTDCPNYHIVSGYAWNTCAVGGAYGIDMWWNGVSGPRDLWIPAYCVGASGLPMDFNATFNVVPQAPGPVPSDPIPASQTTLTRPAPAGRGQP